MRRALFRAAVAQLAGVAGLLAIDLTTTTARIGSWQPDAASGAASLWVAAALTLLVVYISGPSFARSAQRLGLRGDPVRLSERMSSAPAWAAFGAGLVIAVGFAAFVYLVVGPRFLATLVPAG